MEWTQCMAVALQTEQVYSVVPSVAGLCLAVKERSLSFKPTLKRMGMTLLNATAMAIQWPIHGLCELQAIPLQSIRKVLSSNSHKNRIGKCMTGKSNHRQRLHHKETRAAPPRFEHGLLAPQAGVISKLHYRAL